MQEHEPARDREDLQEPRNVSEKLRHHVVLSELERSSVSSFGMGDYGGSVHHRGCEEDMREQAMFHLN